MTICNQNVLHQTDVKNNKSAVQANAQRLFLHDGNGNLERSLDKD